MAFVLLTACSGTKGSNSRRCKGNSMAAADTGSSEYRSQGVWNVDSGTIVEMSYTASMVKGFESARTLSRTASSHIYHTLYGKSMAWNNSVN